jgi:hypothetical protein
MKISNECLARGARARSDRPDRMKIAIVDLENQQSQAALEATVKVGVSVRVDLKFSSFVHHVIAGTAEVGVRQEGLDPVISVRKYKKAAECKTEANA